VKPLLTDKILLVSGGTQGVGAGVVRAAVREGASVAFTGRRPGAGEALAGELTAGSAGPPPVFVRCDLSDPAQATASVEAVVDRSGVVTGSIIDGDQVVIGPYE
jgi:NAD(P)-dependent dehydrogenase (short-subunit alcohol dehydrogenase family)